MQFTFKCSKARKNDITLPMHLVFVNDRANLKMSKIGQLANSSAPNFTQSHFWSYTTTINYTLKF